MQFSQKQMGMHSIVNKSMEENQITGFQLSVQAPTQSCSFFLVDL